MIARASSSARPTASIVPSPRAQSSMKRARSTIIARCLLQTECSRNTGGGDFTDAMADNSGWLHAP